MEHLPSKRKRAIELSTVVRDVLSDQELFKSILSKSKNQPIYEEFLKDNQKNFATGISIAMAIKALSGDVQAANYLMKAGGFEKIDIGIHSDFYNDNRLEIEVLQPHDRKDMLSEATNQALVTATQQIINDGDTMYDDEEEPQPVPRVTVKRSVIEQRVSEDDQEEVQ